MRKGARKRKKERERERERERGRLRKTWLLVVNSTWRSMFIWRRWDSWFLHAGVANALSLSSSSQRNRERGCDKISDDFGWFHRRETCWLLLTRWRSLLSLSLSLCFSVLPPFLLLYSPYLEKILREERKSRKHRELSSPLLISLSPSVHTASISTCRPRSWYSSTVVSSPFFLSFIALASRCLLNTLPFFVFCLFYSSCSICFSFSTSYYSSSFSHPFFLLLFYSIPLCCSSPRRYSLPALWNDATFWQTHEARKPVGPEP